MVLSPILPYPATTYDAILTTIINFQDALKQKGDNYGGLWADEGVYCIAKEIQLMKPDQFNNIFLGLRGFHMEKIVLACLGNLLEFLLYWLRQNATVLMSSSWFQGPHCPFNDTRGPHIYDVGSIPLQFP